jgi:hypothetical protein
MAELDLGESSNLDLATELGTFDVKRHLYEGGSKTWESSRDLAAVLAADYSFLMEEDEVEEIRVIEVSPPLNISEFNPFCGSLSFKYIIPSSGFTDVYNSLVPGPQYPAWRCCAPSF